MRRQGGRRRTGRWQLVVGPVLLLGAWEAASRLELVNPTFFPPPTEIVAHASVLFDGESELGAGVVDTVVRLLATAVLAALLGIGTGLAMASFQRAARGVEMVLSFFYPIPAILFLPMVTFVAGRGETAIIATALVTPYIVISVYTIVGIRQIDRVLIEAGRNFGARGWRYLVRLLVPGALPVIIAGIRVSLGFALISVVATEMVAASTGLGAYLWQSWQVLKVNDMYVALMAVAALGLLSSVGFDAIGNRLLPWRADQGGA